MAIRTLIGLSRDPGRPMLDPCPAGHGEGLFAQECLGSIRKISLTQA